MGKWPESHNGLSPVHTLVVEMTSGSITSVTDFITCGHYLEFWRKSKMSTISKNFLRDKFLDLLGHVEFWLKWKMSFITKTIRDRVISSNFGPSGV